MSMNEIDLLARMRADLPEDPDGLARARQRVLAHTAAPARVAPARRWVWPLAGAGGLAAAAVAVALAVAGGVAPVPGQPAGPAVSAAPDVLLVAAERVAAAPVGAGRYWVSRRESGWIVQVGPDGDRYRVVQRGEGSTWIAQRPGEASVSAARSLGTRPLSPADTAAWQRDGEPTTWTVDTARGGGAVELPAAGGSLRVDRADAGRHVFALGDRNITLRDLDALPADPAQLRETLLAQNFTGGGGDLPTDPDRWLFAVGTDLVFDMPLAPPVRAAAYRMLAGLSGVRDLGEVQDARGRTGRAVAVTEENRNGRFETRLVIDPASGEPLARETRTVGPDGTADLAGYSLVVGTGYTDEDPPAAG